MEAQGHVETSFVTLTYADGNLPSDAASARLAVSAYIKRLRQRVHHVPIRYYAATERGEQTGRLHHHLLLFGLSYLQDYQAIVSAWQLRGLVDVKPARDGSHAYVAGYVLKKVTDPGDRIRPLMSLKPGIGLGQVVPLARQLDNDPRGFWALEALRDVPATLDFGGKSLPLGQTFRRKLRKEVFDVENVPFEAQEMQHLRQIGQPLPGSPEAQNIARQKALNARAKVKILQLKRKL